MSDRLDTVFAALADPTRRQVVELLLAEGETSVPRLSERLPMTRQGIAKHLGALDEAGLLERRPGQGREVRFALRPGAFAEAADWVRRTEDAWDGRLRRLKQTVEQRRDA